MFNATADQVVSVEHDADPTLIPLYPHVLTCLVQMWVEMRSLPFRVGCVVFWMCVGSVNAAWRNSGYPWGQYLSLGAVELVCFHLSSL